jgi:hypothetical protein
LNTDDLLFSEPSLFGGNPSTMVDYIAGPTWMKKCQASSRDWLKEVWGNPHHSARTSIADIVA